MAEDVLWQYVRDRKLSGYKFYRQYSVGPYILDFYCPKIRLAIELDGKSHEQTETRIYDKERSRYLQSLDIHTIRFQNHEILSDLAGVVKKIPLLG